MDIGHIRTWAELVRDVGLILGIPVLIMIGVKLYGQQIEILKARNELLKETQYDRALSIIKSQRELYELERQSLEKSLQDLKSMSATTQSEQEAEIATLRGRLERVTETIGTLDKSAGVIQRASFAQALFRDDAIFRQSKFERTVDFSESLFTADVSFRASLFEAPTSFQNAVFRGRVMFAGADLRSASFDGADLRGVDLSRARVDQNTKLPRVSNEWQITQ